MSKEGVNINSNIDEKLFAISPSLDLTQGPPINQNRTVTFINHFIISMVEFLNKFALTCEHKLFACDQKIKKLEDELYLLEAKLNSIPEVADQNDLPVATVHSPDETTVQESENKDSNSTPVPTEKEDETSAEEPSPNPEVLKYMRMVQVGVPVQAVKLKMQQEGVDPSLLNVKE